jgi:replicative DNA helicase
VSTEGKARSNAIAAVAKDERVILGWWLDNPSDALTSSLTPEHFFNGRHRAICTVMQRPGWTAGELGTVLGESEWLDQIESLGRLASNVTASKVVAAESRLKEHFAVRKALEACGEFRRQAERTPKLSLVSELVSSLAEAESMGPTRSRPHGVVGFEVLEQWTKAISKPDTTITLPLPWSELNDHIGGWVLGKLHLIGGRSSEHKTTVARACAEHLAAQGVRVCYWTAEDSDHDISARTIAASNSILTTQAIARGVKPRQLTEGCLARVIGDAQKSIEGDTGQHMQILDLPNPKLSTVLSMIKIEAAKGAKLLVFDFVQLIRPDKGQPTNDWWRECIAALAGIAKQLQIALVCTSQIEKSGTQASVEAGRIPRGDEMPFGAVLRQGAFGVLMVGTSVKDDGSVRLGIVVDKWKSAANAGSSEEAKFPFDVDPAHDRLTERKRK